MLDDQIIKDLKAQIQKELEDEAITYITIGLKVKNKQVVKVEIDPHKIWEISTEKSKKG